MCPLIGQKRDLWRYETPYFFTFGLVLGEKIKAILGKFFPCKLLFRDKILWIFSMNSDKVQIIRKKGQRWLCFSLIDCLDTQNYWQVHPNLISIDTKILHTEIHQNWFFFFLSIAQWNCFPSIHFTPKHFELNVSLKKLPKLW